MPIIHPRRETLRPSTELKNCSDKSPGSTPYKPQFTYQMMAEKILQAVPKSALPDSAEIWVWHEQHSLRQHWCEWGKTHSHPWRLSPAQQRAPTVIHEPTNALAMALWVRMSFYLQREIFLKDLSSHLHTNICGSGLEKSWVRLLKSHTSVTLSCWITQSSRVPWVLKGKACSHNLIFHSCYGRWIWNVNSCFGTVQHYSLAERIF